MRVRLRAESKRPELARSQVNSNVPQVEPYVGSRDSDFDMDLTEEVESELERSNNDNTGPGLLQPKTENDEPRQPVDCSGIDDPEIKKSSAKGMLPRRAVLRAGSSGPVLAKSWAGTQSPKRALPNTKAVDPSLAVHLTSKLGPISPESGEGGVRSGRAALRGDGDKPRHVESGRGVGVPRAVRLKAGEIRSGRAALRGKGEELTSTEPGVGNERPRRPNDLSSEKDPRFTESGAKAAKPKRTKLRASGVKPRRRESNTGEAKSKQALLNTGNADSTRRPHRRNEELSKLVGSSSNSNKPARTKLCVSTDRPMWVKSEMNGAGAMREADLVGTADPDMMKSYAGKRAPRQAVLHAGAASSKQA